MQNISSRCSDSPLLSDLVVAGFHALSDPLRLNVIELLRQQELCVCDLCTALAVSQSKLSFHLKTLKAAQLVRSRQAGRWIYYSLNLPQFAALEQCLADVRRFSPIMPARMCRDPVPQLTQVGALDAIVAE